MNGVSQKDYKFKKVNMLITKLCNLHCRMCDYRINNFNYKPMSLNKILSVIEEIKDLDAKVLELSGGEPMIRKDIFEIINFASSLGLDVYLMTNGVLIGETEAQKLIESGLKGVSISLEGPEELNDKIRGRGNYQKALKAIKFFETYKNQMDAFTTVGVTLSKYNYKYILPFSKFLLEDIRINSVTLNPYNSLMLTEKNQKIRHNEFVIDDELITDFKKELDKIINYSEIMGYKMPSLNFLQKIPDYFQGKCLVPKGGCHIPLVSCGITADGSIFPCWRTSRKGDLNELSLKQILKSQLYRNFVDDALSGKCVGCLTSCYSEIY